MAYNPKLSVYIITLKPKKKDETKTFRDFLCEKYAGDSTTSEAKLLLDLFETFVNSVGKDEFSKDDKNKRVMGVDDGQILPLTLSSEEGFFDGVIEGGKYGVLREYADTDKKADKQVILPSNAVLDKYYILLNPVLNNSYAILLVQSYTEVTIQGSITTLIDNLFSGCTSFYKVQIDSFVPNKFMERYKESAKVRMFSFTVPTQLSESLRNTIQEADQEFEVEIRIKPKSKAMSLDSEGTEKVIREYGRKTLDSQTLDNGNGKIYTVDALGHNANYDIEKEIRSIRPTIYLSDEGITSDPDTGIPDFSVIRTYCRNLLKDIRAERDINQNIDEF